MADVNSLVITWPTSLEDGGNSLDFWDVTISVACGVRSECAWLDVAAPMSPCPPLPASIESGARCNRADFFKVI